MTETSRSHWLDRYINMADTKSPMTPREFHEAIGLWLISTAIARRMVVNMPHDDVYPNLWIMVVARSTLYGKTTAINIARHVIGTVANELLLPEASTPEALIESLSKSSQRGLVLDEASGLLAASERDYMAGTLELFMRLYDCTPSYTRQTKGGGVNKIEAGYVSMLAASTPALMRRHLKSDRLWASGWWPRFGIVIPPDTRPEFRRAQFVDPSVSADLGAALTALRSRLKCVPPNALSVAIQREALDEWLIFDEECRYTNQFDHSENLGAAYGRAPTTALKIATCLAAMDWTTAEPAPLIDLHNMRRGIAIARNWLDCAARAIMQSEAPETDKNLDRVLQILKQANGGFVTLRDLSRKTKLKAAELEAILTNLEGVEEAEVNECVRGHKASIQARWTGKSELSPDVTRNVTTQ